MAVQLAPKGIRVNAVCPGTPPQLYPPETSIDDVVRPSIHPSPARLAATGQHGEMVGRRATATRTSEHAG